MIDINLWPAFSMCTFIFGVWVGQGQGRHVGYWEGYAACKLAWDKWESFRASTEFKQLGKGKGKGNEDN